MHGLFSFWKDTPRIYLHEPERDFLLYLWALHLQREQTEEVSVSLINDLGLTQLELRGLCWKSVWPSKPSPVSVSYQCPHTHVGSEAFLSPFPLGITSIPGTRPQPAQLGCLESWPRGCLQVGCFRRYLHLYLHLHLHLHLHLQLGDASPSLHLPLCGGK